MMPDLTPEQIDLLLSVMDGSLEGEELARARAEIASDAVLAEELRLQEAALTHLSTERHAPMADFEAARMRRGVLDEVLPQKPARTPWFARLVPAAAVLALVVAGIGFVGNLGSEDTADLATDDVAAVAPADDDSAAADAREEAATATEAPSMEMAPKDDAPEDTEAADGDIAAAMPAEFPLLELGPLTDAPLDDDILEEMRAMIGGEPVPFFAVSGACDGVTWEDVTYTEVTAAATAMFEGSEVLVVEVADGTVLVVDRTTCSATATR